jgi:geranylgeranyl diphosphate synthase type I
MGAITDQLSHTRRAISACLQGFIDEKRVDLALINPLGPDVADRILSSSLQGKMLRGSLVHLGHCIATGGRLDAEPSRAVTIAAAAMELFQSGLLVHDDIMDRDRTRRGHASLWQQYALRASAEGNPDPGRVGESMGICAGDVAYFLAFELLSCMETEPSVLRIALGLCAAELTRVGIAQMQDVAWGASSVEADEREILRMYTYKTGRYTFSLPLLTGALIGGAPPLLRDELARIGESIGMLFQIRDDELGIFGTEEEIGKPVGSDVREGKKTLFSSSLLSVSSGEERQRLRGIFGNGDCSAEDLAFVRGALTAHGIRETVERVARRLADDARSLIAGMHAAREPDRDALRALLDFAVARRQ